jgi:hypothetical protein
MFFLGKSLLLYHEAVNSEQKDFKKNEIDAIDRLIRIGGGPQDSSYLKALYKFRLCRISFKGNR